MRSGDWQRVHMLVVIKAIGRDKVVRGETSKNIPMTVQHRS